VFGDLVDQDHPKANTVFFHFSIRLNPIQFSDIIIDNSVNFHSIKVLEYRELRSIREETFVNSDILKTIEHSITRRQALKIAAFCGAGALFCGTALTKPASHPDTTEWQDLIAPDLSNVDMPAGSWEMKDGVLAAKTHDTIWTQKSYGNFIVDMEFKVA